MDRRRVPNSTGANEIQRTGTKRLMDRWRLAILEFNFEMELNIPGIGGAGIGPKRRASDRRVQTGPRMTIEYINQVRSKIDPEIFSKDKQLVDLNILVFVAARSHTI